MENKKRGRPPRRPPEAIYVVEITSWEWRYGIGEASYSRDLAPVVEHRDIVIHGVPRGPKLGKVTKAEVHLEPGWKLERLNEPKEGEDVLIGSIWMTTGVFQVMRRVTDKAAAAILQMLVADRLRFARIGATPLHYRTGNVRHLSLQMDLAEDEDVAA